MAPGAASQQEQLTLFLIDSRPYAKRDLILQATINELGRSPRKSMVNSIQVKRLDGSDYAEAAMALNQNSGIVFIVITEEELSSHTEGHLPRAICKSIEAGYQLIDQSGSGSDIYFVVKDMTGVDVISLLLSGARGVIDPDVLGSANILRQLIDATHDENKKMHRILAGRPYRKLDNVIQMAKGRWQIAQQHWALLLALAEVPEEKLKCEYPPNQDRVTKALAKYENVTGYITTTNTSRKIPLVLDLVSGELNESEDEENATDHGGQIIDGAVNQPKKKERSLNPEMKAELPFLPLYVRRLGFPKHLLPIRGIDQSDLHNQLHKGMTGIHILRSDDEKNIEIATVTLPRNLW